MSDGYWNMDAVPLTERELERLKFAMGVLMGTHIGLGNKPCFYMWAEVTGWGRTMAVCGCELPRIKVKEMFIEGLTDES